MNFVTPTAPPADMEHISPQVMHKLVFTVLVHGLPDAQTGVALDVLQEAQSNANPQVRELAVVALAELPVPPAKRVAALMKGVQDSAARVRRRAARALGDFGMHALPAVPMLTGALKDADASVRRDAAGALGRFGMAAAPAAGTLVTLLADPDTRTRVVVGIAVRRIGRPALPALLQALRFSDAEIRARAATIAARIAPGDDEVTAALRRAAATDPDDEVRQSAAEALDGMKLPYATLATA
ncbi:MAG TPA: HEAT repeat domain-containing protein [Gemmata sp.]|nr:HEAT repeat domain-containing protein [Gemmata sp.]